MLDSDASFQGRAEPFSAFCGGKRVQVALATHWRLQWGERPPPRAWSPFTGGSSAESSHHHVPGVQSLEVQLRKAAETTYLESIRWRLQCGEKPPSRAWSPFTAGTTGASSTKPGVQSLEAPEGRTANFMRLDLTHDLSASSVIYTFSLLTCHRARNLQARGEGVRTRCRRPKTIMDAKVTSA